MGTRDAKNWLESVMLNDTTLSGDSETDVVTEHAVKTYVDNNAGEPFEPVNSLVLTDLNSPFDASAGYAYLVNAASGAVVVNLPSVGQGDRILIHAYDATNTITLNAQAGESIQGRTSMELTHAQSFWLIGSVDHDFNSVWTPGTAATSIMAGHETLSDVAYKVVEILSAQGNIETTCTVDATGQTLATENTSGDLTLDYDSAGGTDLVMTATGTSTRSRLRLEDTSGNYISLYMTNGRGDVRLDSSFGQTIIMNANGIGLNAIAGSGSPLAITDSLPVYLNNSDAVSNGLSGGDLYRLASGALMVVF